MSLAGALSLQDFSPSQFHAGALWGWDQVGWDQVVKGVGIKVVITQKDRL